MADVGRDITQLIQAAAQPYVPREELNNIKQNLMDAATSPDSTTETLIAIGRYAISLTGDDNYKHQILQAISKSPACTEDILNGIGIGNRNNRPSFR